MYLCENCHDSFTKELKKEKFPKDETNYKIRLKTTYKYRRSELRISVRLEWADKDVGKSSKTVAMLKA